MASENSLFPFFSLPPELQNNILYRLPVSDLISFSVFRSFSSLLFTPTFPSPPPDLFFLLYTIKRAPPHEKILSFHPSSRRWIYLPIPSSSFLYNAFAPWQSPLTLPSCGQDLFVVRMLSRLPAQMIPQSNYVGSESIIALISDVADQKHFKIVANCYPTGRVFCQVYDSRIGKWSDIGDTPHYTRLDAGNSAVINSSLFMHGIDRSQLLKLDLISYTLSLISPMPGLIVCSHLFSHNDNIYLIGVFRANEDPDDDVDNEDVEEVIKVFVLNWSENGESGVWSQISLLSEADEIFQNLNCYLESDDFRAVSRNGYVCVTFDLGDGFLLFDATTISWNWISPLSSIEYPGCYWSATEAGLEVLEVLEHDGLL
ncbi:hypothetical protein LUZ63_010280 [Rhynchospora breviuscula]|uniref:F-box domain-containing protein n=1 Tax=Rhynchospora breviuscula TaxID=2022672 RepID=A0A9Q0HPH8_9POAL|nr:hypothetical protein LUZ63_010280 [Rhynchospora breviuscula]